MAHNIFDQRFYTYRQPAWHKLGTVSQQPHSAREAGALVGLPRILEQSVAARFEAGYVTIPGLKAVWGSTVIAGKAQLTPYCVVSQDYQVLAHTTFCDVVDEATHHHVETLGLLDDGKQLFLTLPVTTFTVAGDEVQAFFLVLNPLDGGTAIQARLTSVRVVCKNTMDMAMRAQTQRAIRIRHRSAEPVADQLRTWLRTTWAETAGMTALLREAYDAMARVRVTPDDAAGVVASVYPVTARPEEPARWTRWEQDSARQRQHQDHVLTLFRDSATHTEATQGTAWGLYNMLVEYEDHGRRSPATSVVFGAGAQRKQRAFDACVALRG